MSGPLKIAASLEVSKISATPTIVKDQHKIGRDLYTQKDESDFSKVHVSQRNHSFSIPSLEEASLASRNLAKERCTFSDKDSFHAKKKEIALLAALILLQAPIFLAKKPQL